MPYAQRNLTADDGETLPRREGKEQDGMTELDGKLLDAIAPPGAHGMATAVLTHVAPSEHDGEQAAGPSLVCVADGKGEDPQAKTVLAQPTGGTEGMLEAEPAQHVAQLLVVGRPRTAAVMIEKHGEIAELTQPDTELQQMPIEMKKGVDDAQHLRQHRHVAASHADRGHGSRVEEPSEAPFGTGRGKAEQRVVHLEELTVVLEGKVLRHGLAVLALLAVGGKGVDRPRTDNNPARTVEVGRRDIEVDVARHTPPGVRIERGERLSLHDDVAYGVGREQRVEHGHGVVGLPVGTLKVVEGSAGVGDILRAEAAALRQRTAEQARDGLPGGRILKLAARPGLHAERPHGCSPELRAQQHEQKLVAGHASGRCWSSDCQTE